MASNNMVMEMIDDLDEDESFKNSMREIFQTVSLHSNGPATAKYKINNCRKIIEKAIK